MIPHVSVEDFLFANLGYIFPGLQLLKLLTNYCKSVTHHIGTQYPTYKVLVEEILLCRVFESDMAKS